MPAMFTFRIMRSSMSMYSALGSMKNMRQAQNTPPRDAQVSL